MRTRLWKLFAVVAALVLLVGACGDPDEENSQAGGGGASPTEQGAGELTTIEEGVLTVGSDIPYPPFEVRKGGRLSGFDIDLIREIASRLNLQLSDDDIIDTSFDTILSQLAGGRFDVVVAASTITPEREKQVNFSDPYYNSQQSLTVNTEERSDIATLEDLQEGDIVAVQSGTTGKSYAEENVPEGVDIRSFPEGPDVFTALEAGQVDVAIHDEPTAIAEVAERPGLELVDTIDTGEAFGIAVDPSNEPLLDAINQALSDMVEDGTYEEIYNRYPDLPPGGNVAKD